MVKVNPTLVTSSSARSYPPFAPTFFRRGERLSWTPASNSSTCILLAREKAEAEARELASGLEAKVRCLVDSNIIGIIIWSHDGRITDANEAFLRIVGFNRADLLAGRVSWMELTPPEWHGADAQRLAMLKATGIATPYEKEYVHKNGHRVPVLVGGAAFDEAGENGAAFVVDLTDRKNAEQAARESESRYAEVQAELEHANRVATVGQLSASIAHEVKQPITAAITNAEAALGWLETQPINMEEVRRALNRVVNSSNRPKIRDEIFEDAAALGGKGFSGRFGQCNGWLVPPSTGSAGDFWDFRGFQAQIRRWRLIVRLPKSTTSARDHDVSGMAPPSRMMRAHRSRMAANMSNMAAPICKKICRPWRTILPAV